MQALLKWGFVVGLAVWLGTIVFMSFVVAPAVFRALPRPEAGQVVGAIFPRYYAVSAVCGAVVLLCASGLLGAGAARGPWGVTAGLAAVLLAVTVYAGAVVQPRAAALRAEIHAPNPSAGAQAEFDRLHALAVGLNVAVLLGTVGLSILAASRIQP